MGLFAIVNVNTNGLVWLTEMPDPLIGAPLIPVYLDRDDWPDPVREAWDETARRFVPRSKRVITRLAFLRKFTAGERVAVRAACAVSPELSDFMALLDMAESVDLDDDDIVSGVSMLAQAGLIAPERVAQVLS